MSKRVVVTGLGLVTPLGVGVKHSWSNLIAGKSGLISTTTLPGYKEDGWDQITSKVIGKVPSGPLSEGKWNPNDHFAEAESRRLAEFTQYSLAASQESMTDAKWFPSSEEEQNYTGISVGSGIGSIQDTYENSVKLDSIGYKKTQPLFIPKMLSNMAAGNISIRYKLRGPNHSVSTACATGIHSIGDSYNFIKNNYAKVMVAGGTEASIHPLGLAAFSRARSVTTKFNDEPEKASRPFDKDRDGFVLAEGCGIVVLEELEHALSRGLTEDDIYAEVIGYGLSGDANHITAPPEDGGGAYRAMEMCLQFAGVKPEQIDYINAHATSTVIGDRSENRAISNLFKNNKNLAISSNKSSLGHLLGAAGAVESIFTILSIKHDIVSPTLNLDNPGGRDDDPKHLFEKFDYVVNKSQQKQVRFALCNSFGFGGTNGTLCFSKYKSQAQ
ncbi:Piso0_000688 [Millerozyma farinosa CBS 7064]|uniref:3-oxoacyl-[acyl-carrier-protein] synthase n=1 Tax=Pichia sorbitophila (strain ATCC MYA-4447 / BCRC 22081 / CBS 7064 / NBRC 10061 / NRRL Y-12695) TaxID=559304 RepID=G8YR88_PICSO|nr:Piso0_000688 [Millerozyma farinosa CBS 7064]